MPLPRVAFFTNCTGHLDMTNRILVIFFILSGLLGGLRAEASDLSYTYAELRFVNTEIGNADGDGLRLNGSFELNQNWLLVGGFTALDFDGDVDTSTLEAGVGYVHPYNEGWDIVGYGKLVRTEVDTPFGDGDDTGFSLGGGVRGSVTPQFEARASINYFDVADSDTFFEIGGDYYFTEQVSAGLTLDFGGDADTLTFGVRWFFDQ